MTKLYLEPRYTPAVDTTNPKKSKTAAVSNSKQQINLSSSKPKAQANRSRVTASTQQSRATAGRSKGSSSLNSSRNAGLFNQEPLTLTRPDVFSLIYPALLDQIEQTTFAPIALPQTPLSAPAEIAAAENQPAHLPSKPMPVTNQTAKEEIEKLETYAPHLESDQDFIHQAKKLVLHLEKKPDEARLVKLFVRVRAKMVQGEIDRLKQIFSGSNQQFDFIAEVKPKLETFKANADHVGLKQLFSNLTTIRQVHEECLLLANAAPQALDIQKAVKKIKQDLHQLAKKNNTVGLIKLLQEVQARSAYCT